MDEKGIKVTEMEVTIKIQVENVFAFERRLEKGLIQFSVATKANLMAVDVKELGKKTVTITGEEIKPPKEIEQK